MSPTLLRLLLALALAFTVPVQGFAAAASAICMQFGHHTADAGHAHDEGDSDAHDHQGHGADRSESSASPCAPCVACCAASAISCAPAAVTAREGAAAVNALAPPSFAGFQPDTLDRPPLAL
jgi:hypothetical protein